MNDKVGDISLRVRHPSVDVGSLLEKMGFEVGRSWVAGSPRCTPKGQPLEGRYGDSYAYTKLSSSNGDTLSERLEDALAIVSPHSVELIEFVEIGGNVEFFVGWYFDGNSGDVLDWQLLVQMANSKISLSLDVYPSERDLEDTANGEAEGHLPPLPRQ